MEIQKTPTWYDVNISEGLISLIQSSDNVEIISFLIDDRVFRKENKINYQYICSSCGYAKLITKQHEEYFACLECKSKRINGTPCWKYHRNINSQITSANIIDRMALNYFHYFNAKNEKIVDLEWQDGLFMTKFATGERVLEETPAESISKAAILCPFLWDSNFNWKTLSHNDRGNDLHISHIIAQWAW